MSAFKWAGWFIVVLLSVAALAILGLAIGGTVTMFALLFLGLVGEGLWVRWRVTHGSPPPPHR